MVFLVPLVMREVMREIKSLNYLTQHAKDSWLFVRPAN